MPLHPTPLYSILWNGLIGLLLIRLWGSHSALSLIISLYFTSFSPVSDASRKRRGAASLRRVSLRASGSINGQPSPA